MRLSSVENDGPISAANLEPGDLLFCARGGFGINTLDKFAQERWRHVGVVSSNERGEPTVIEVAGHRFRHRRLNDFFPAYDEFGYARLGLAKQCIASATKWMDDRTHEDNFYAMDDLVLAGIIVATRRAINERHRPRIVSAVRRAADACSDRPIGPGSWSLTCSAFVYFAYKNAQGECSLAHDLWRDWPPAGLTLDEIFGASPVAVFHSGRSVLELFHDELKHGTQNPKRSVGDISMTATQFRETLQVLMAAVGGFAFPNEHAHDIDPAKPLSDGRWVTPGDLWESSSVRCRGRVIPPTGGLFTES